MEVHFCKEKKKIDEKLGMIKKTLMVNQNY